MASEHAIGRTVVPFPAYYQPFHRPNGVRAAHGVTDVSGGSDLCGRNDPAFAAPETTWPVSVLARFLAPHCGTLLADTLSRQLIDSFGSLARAVTAPAAAIERVCGQGSGVAEAIALARELILSATAEHVMRSVVTVADPQLHAYLRQRMIRLRHEELFVVFLDPASRFIHSQSFSTQQCNEVSARIDKIYRKAIDLESFGLLLAHNHPSGDPRPSANDYRANERLKQVGEALGITLVDHLIVAGSTIFSMREGRAL